MDSFTVKTGLGSTRGRNAPFTRITGVRVQEVGTTIDFTPIGVSGKELNAGFDMEPGAAREMAKGILGIRESRRCYYAQEFPHTDGYYHIVTVTENEPDYEIGQHFHRTREISEELADKWNMEQFGLDCEQAQEIVDSSLAAALKREAPVSRAKSVIEDFNELLQAGRDTDVEEVAQDGEPGILDTLIEQAQIVMGTQDGREWLSECYPTLAAAVGEDG